MSFIDPDHLERLAKEVEERRKEKRIIIDALPSASTPPRPTAVNPHAMPRLEVDSLREWLASWGDGPNWADPSGASIPIPKSTLRRLLDAASDTAK